MIVPVLSRISILFWVIMRCPFVSSMVHGPSKRSTSRIFSQDEKPKRRKIKTKILRMRINELLISIKFWMQITKWGSLVQTLRLLNLMHKINQSSESQPNKKAQLFSWAFVTSSRFKLETSWAVIRCSIQLSYEAELVCKSKNIISSSKKKRERKSL